jgi:hypothetical protein
MSFPCSGDGKENRDGKRTTTRGDREGEAGGLDDRFCFECKRCGQCCFRCEIVLTPYDILRLCQGVRITTGEFLD